MLMLDVFPAQMDRLMLIFANPLRSTRGATLLCSSAFDLDSGGDCKTGWRHQHANSKS